MIYLIKYRKLFSIFLNLNAPNCLRNRFKFLSNSRGPLRRSTRASRFDLKVPYPQGNSGKRTLAYSAIKLFNELSSDLKEFYTTSSLPTFKFLSSSLMSKLRNLFLSRLCLTPSTRRTYCARFAAILFIVNVFHNGDHNSCRVFFTYFTLFYKFIYYNFMTCF